MMFFHLEKALRIVQLLLKCLHPLHASFHRITFARRNGWKVKDDGKKWYFWETQDLLGIWLVNMTSYKLKSHSKLFQDIELNSIGIEITHLYLSPISAKRTQCDLCWQFSDCFDVKNWWRYQIPMCLIWWYWFCLKNPHFLACMHLQRYYWRLVWKISKWYRSFPRHM